jgi:protein gp37
VTTEIGWAHVPDGKGGRKIGRTLNHQVGCREVSPACRLCYAAKLAHRGMSPQHKGLTVMRTNAAGEPLGVHWNGKINRVSKALAQALRWTKPSGIFVGSMTDTFFDVSTDEACRWIATLFGVMAASERHTYMLLTKRPENAAIFFAWLDRQCEGMEDERAPVIVCLSAALDVLTEKRDLDKINAAIHDDSIAWPLSNCWLGVTAEDQRRADERIQILVDLPAAVHYVSYEPACSAVDFTPWLGRLGWLIAGGESGSGASPSHPDWFRSARDQCERAGVPFFFKQWGSWKPETVANKGPKKVMSSDGTTLHLGMYGRECLVCLDSFVYNGSPALDGRPGRIVLARSYTADNGRELDGRTWDGFPTVSHG